MCNCSFGFRHSIAYFETEFILDASQNETGTTKFQPLDKKLGGNCNVWNNDKTWFFGVNIFLQNSSQDGRNAFLETLEFMFA
jgi:hypothetical protein